MDEPIPTSDGCSCTWGEEETLFPKQQSETMEEEWITLSIPGTPTSPVVTMVAVETPPNSPAVRWRGVPRSIAPIEEGTLSDSLPSSARTSLDGWPPEAGPLRIEIVGTRLAATESSPFVPTTYHNVFVIEVTERKRPKEKRIIYKRYNAFLKLYQAICNVIGQASLAGFPPKLIVHDITFMQTRIKQLNDFMKDVMLLTVYKEKVAQIVLQFII